MKPMMRILIISLSFGMIAGCATTYDVTDDGYYPYYADSYYDEYPYNDFYYSDAYIDDYPFGYVSYNGYYRHGGYYGGYGYHGGYGWYHGGAGGSFHGGGRSGGGGRGGHR